MLKYKYIYIKQKDKEIDITEIDLARIELKLDNLTNNIKSFETRLNKLDKRNPGGRFWWMKDWLEVFYVWYRLCVIALAVFLIIQLFDFLSGVSLL